MNKKPVSALLTIIAIAFSFTLGPASYAKGAKGTKGVGDTLPLVSTNNCAIYYAGQHIAIGSVCITISDGIVYIDYILENGWKLNEAHAWAGDSLANVPKTGSGNPIPGQFPLSGNPSGVTTYTLSAPLSTR
jgi:hypothetical protein